MKSTLSPTVRRRRRWLRSPRRTEAERRSWLYEDRLGGRGWWVETPSGGLRRCRTLGRWAKFFEHADRTVAKTAVEDVLVSTVFLGLDHNFFGEGPPLLYESMLFDAEDNSEGGWRYSTRAEALAGHRRIVAELEERLGATALEAL